MLAGIRHTGAGPDKSGLRRPRRARRRLDHRFSRKRRPRWRAALRHRGAAEGNRGRCSRRGDRPPRQARLRAIFRGHDEPWGEGGGQHDFDATTKHDMRSASKSVTSLLVGIAIDRKLIAGADEPVVKFFPDYSALKSPGWDNITLRHLLTMSSGMQWDENRAWNDPKNDEPHLGSEADPIRYVLSKPIAAPPDTVWTYNGGGTDLLGNIVERVSGKSLEAFARETLFAPLGISDWEWMKYRNETHRRGRRPSPASARCRKDRPARAQQAAPGTAGRSSRPEWIEQSVTAALPGDRLFRRAVLLRPAMVDGPLASGRQGSEVDCGAWASGGQRIFIVPELDLVVMTTSGLYVSGRQGDGALDMPRELHHSIRPGQTTRTNPAEENNHEPQICRRRSHHSPHHRAGNHLPAGAGDAAGPDAGAVGGEPAVDAKGRRARRQGRADPVLSSPMS